MRYRCMLIGLLILLAAEARAEVYRYRDADGVIHFTDNYIEIPEDRRPKVETILDSDASAAPVVQTEIGAPEDGAAAEAPAEAEKPRERANAFQPEAVAARGTPPLRQLEALVKDKADLDKIYDALATEKEALEKEQETLKTIESMRAFQNKVNIFNKKLADYERRRQAFQVRADAYNAAVDR